MNYYLKDTTDKVVDTKTVTGQMMNQWITETAPDIKGYSKVEPSSARIQLKEANNEIIFYYEIDDSQTKKLGYTVRYYRDNVEVTGDAQTVEKDVWVNADELAVDGVDTANDKYVGYKFDHTDPEAIPGTIAGGGEIKVYYVKDESQTKTLSYTVEYYQDGTMESEDEITAVVWINDPDTLTVDKATIAPTDKYGDEYILETKLDELPETITNDGKIRVEYARDVLTDPDDPDVNPDPNKPGDGIPDRYQVEVTFQVVNGSWADGTTGVITRVVTLRDDNGFSEDGTAILSDIPVAQASEGYRNGVWDENPNGFEITKTSKKAFIIAYEAIPPAPSTDPGTPDPDPDPDDPDPVVPPVPPTPPTPDEPETVIPAVPVPLAPAPAAPAAAALVAIPEVAVPLADLDLGDDEGEEEGVELVTIGEEEIPLAEVKEDDHKCCILSFLLMLATLIIYTWFTHSMKKRQKKLAELKDQLAEETLKRQLGITDQKSRRR